MRLDKSKTKILFLVPYPFDSAPGQRFRYEQYQNHLIQNNFSIEYSAFLDEKTNRLLYYPREYFSKIIGVIKGFVRRFYKLLFIWKYDFIFIYREASPIGPPIFEWLIAKVFKKKIIYDFDDAIWLPNISEQNKIAAKLKWHSKVSVICKWSYKISVGNAYLANYASQFNSRTIINPTTIDTEKVHNKIKYHLANKELKTIIGWTGSHSTLQYLNDIVSILKELEEAFNIEFQVISNKDPKLPLKNYTFIKWQTETEIDDLFKFDIGLMPLTEDQWAAGKCGFKALQYMALGIPPLVSPVGVNTEIVQHGKNGFICSSNEDWTRYLVMLIEDCELRNTLGSAARKTIEEKYSVKSNEKNFLRLFRASLKIG